MTVPAHAVLPKTSVIVKVAAYVVCRSIWVEPLVLPFLGRLFVFSDVKHSVHVEALTLAHYLPGCTPSSFSMETCVVFKPRVHSNWLLALTNIEL